ncbi:hypothetical protein NEUTE1DRAFT_117238 [Neurospora tetrasperma FGSC 2508]|uniref:Uncharacterized protein n=1 Tax=Neurospora tetrasperma (strain FGSC 2508 / ATCC MYA-4615 / P0657) TaxID=510951 RepID=F8MNT0_NEUT8|nr:uncharacterized protein NEUTE1DRAFT_117238 [Neurospora tetrasperma FGSC 2508]EGO56202.1 hypothetical protein NEUTE1DRAFT_117238 [Neurospora tetrasperma FGSC 2508]EGZ70943.1 hypothetical protein NEUTE2DRAFT_145236 [Neurospora tetrasperma FGSC 2509]
MTSLLCSIFSVTRRNKRPRWTWQIGAGLFVSSGLATSADLGKDKAFGSPHWFQTTPSQVQEQQSKVFRTLVTRTYFIQSGQ